MWIKVIFLLEVASFDASFLSMARILLHWDSLSAIYQNKSNLIKTPFLPKWAENHQHINFSSAPQHSIDGLDRFSWFIFRNLIGRLVHHCLPSFILPGQCEKILLSHLDHTVPIVMWTLCFGPHTTLPDAVNRRKIGILRESHLPNAISLHFISLPSHLPVGMYHGESVCVLLRTRDDYVALASKGPVSTGSSWVNIHT